MTEALAAQVRETVLSPHVIGSNSPAARAPRDVEPLALHFARKHAVRSAAPSRA